MPRGRNTGAGGNRIDNLLPNVTAPGQEYGQAASQRMAMNELPMGAPPEVQPAASPQAARQAPMSLAQMVGQQQQAAPVSVTPLTAPTERPDEPITAGLPFGQGAGPEALGQGQLLSDMLAQISQHPSAGAGTFEMAAAARAMGL